MMSGIRNKNTKPELLIRKELYSRGYRYRLHSSTLPGKPDLVMKRYQAAIFINGCFWHGHDCHLFKWPSTRSEFWKLKIERNRTRDQEVQEALKELGWRRLVIWECSLRGNSKLNFYNLISSIYAWLEDNKESTEIRGS